MMSKKERAATHRLQRSETVPRAGAKTREKLVGAAANLFNDVGFHGTDSNRIARAAGYAPATFYKHFKDKREIFLAAYEQWVIAEWNAIRAEVGGPGHRSLSRITSHVVDHHRRWAAFRRSLRALALTDSVVASYRTDQRRIQLRFMSELLAHVGRRRPSSAKCLLALLSFERVCDAIADGEVDDLGVSENAMIRGLQDQLLRLAS